MADEPAIIDSHVHLDLIERYHPHRIQWLKDNNCRVVSWSYFEGVTSVAHLQECLTSKAKCIHKLCKDGLDCLYLAGIHPRSIPPDITPEKIAALLNPFLEDPLCKGIGEIGLETGTTKEQDIFAAQLELGATLRDRSKTVGIHTPRANKQPMTKATLKILRQFSETASAIVIDHCTIDTIADVLNNGFWAGVTVSGQKTSVAELERVLTQHSDRIQRIMCNTDSGSSFFEDTVRLYRNNTFPNATCDQILYRNAARFFSII